MKLKIIALLALLSPLGFTLPAAAIETFNSSENPAVMLLAQEDWHQHISEKFTIQMPNQPESSQNSEEIDEELNLTFNEITSEDDKGAYGLIHTDLPDNYLQKNDSQAVLDYMSDLFLMAMQLEGLKELEQSIDREGNPGREYRVVEPTGALIMQLYLVEKRVYFLFAVSSEENQVNQFVNSFDLL